VLLKDGTFFVSDFFLNAQSLRMKNGKWIVEETNNEQSEEQLSNQ